MIMRTGEHDGNLYEKCYLEGDIVFCKKKIGDADKILDKFLRQHNRLTA